jgi:hypothetical protein
LRRGELTSASLELERRQDFHPNHLFGSSYEPQHLTPEEVVRRRGLTGEVVRAVTTDGVEVEMMAKSARLLLAWLLSYTQVS